MKNIQQFFTENPHLDGFLVSKLENIFYLTGFQGSFGYCLLLKNGQNFLITDNRYAEAAENLAKKSRFEFLVFDKNFEENIQTKIPRNFQNLAVENSLTLAQKNYWQGIFSSAEFVSQDKIIESWRLIKNTNELQKIKKACNKVNKVFDDVGFFRGILCEGKTEKEIAFQLEMKLRENGKYELSFPIIVAFGENSALPHHHPSDRRLKSRENILIDCGVRFENYCSDITRNFYLGDPKKDFCDIFAKILEVQKKTISQFETGNSLAETEKFCRAELSDLNQYFTHSLGHGVGIEVHERPTFSQDFFAENQVVTCEPGIYLPGKFGIRIEDQILITKNGPDVLTKTTKELIVL